MNGRCPCPSAAARSPEPSPGGSGERVAREILSFRCGCVRVKKKKKKKETNCSSHSCSLCRVRNKWNTCKIVGPKESINIIMLIPHTSAQNLNETEKDETDPQMGEI